MDERYEMLEDIYHDGLIRGKYIVYERDNAKGIRITTLDSDSCAIIREEYL